MGIREEIRRKKQSERQLLSMKEKRLRSDFIFQKLLSHPWFQEAKSIHTYVSLEDEVSTRKLIDYGLISGKTVYIPKVFGKGQMEFYQIRSKEELKPGPWQIPEPTNLSRERLSSGNHSLFLLPCIAFDKNCHRLGYGGGYYDRYLSAHKKNHTICLAFSIQESKNIEIPHESHDVIPELILTETKEYKVMISV